MWAAVAAAVAVPLGGWHDAWNPQSDAHELDVQHEMYGPSCTALPRIGSDCSTHPVWRHDDESTWAARIRVCCWLLLFLMLVKVCVCRARSAAKAWLSALVTASARGTDVSGSPLTKSSMMLPAGMSPSVWPASTAQAVSASVVGSYPAAGVK